jgi:hypothetical protein
MLPHRVVLHSPLFDYNLHFDRLFLAEAGSARQLAHWRASRLAAREHLPHVGQ